RDDVVGEERDRGEHEDDAGGEEDDEGQLAPDGQVAERLEEPAARALRLLRGPAGEVGAGLERCAQVGGAKDSEAGTLCRRRAVRYPPRVDAPPTRPVGRRAS